MANSAAQDIMATINKAMGRDVLKAGSDKSLKVTHIPTGMLPVDALLHGGLPVGRFTLIVGDYSTLKSYIGLCAIRECQAQGKVAALIDTERAFDPDWAEGLGVNVDDLLIYPPRDAPVGEFFPGELAIDTAEMMTRQGVDLIVFDSIAATLPQAEQNKRLHDENIQPARLAALMSAASRRLTAANSKTAYLWINQFRLNVGMTFGDPNVITGGKAMPYYASHIIIAKKVGKITRDIKVHDGQVYKSTKEQVVQKYQLTVSKSKLSKPFRDVYFDWDLITGAVDTAGYLISRGLEIGAVVHNKSTWEMDGLKAIGRDKFKQALIDDPESMLALENMVREESNLPLIEAPPVVEAPKPPKPVAKKRTTKKAASKPAGRSMKRKSAK